MENKENLNTTPENISDENKEKNSEENTLTNSEEANNQQELDGKENIEKVPQEIKEQQEEKEGKDQKAETTNHLQVDEKEEMKETEKEPDKEEKEEKKEEEKEEEKAKQASNAGKKEEEEEELDPEYFNTLERGALVDLIEEKVQVDDIGMIKKHIGLIKAAFRNKTNQEKQEHRDNFINKGGNEEEYETPEDLLEQRFSAAFGIYKEKKAKYIEETEKLKQENLKAKNDILEELRNLIESDEELKTTYDTFRELQEKWRQIGPVPQKERNNLWQNYHFLVEKFFDKVKINKELKDLDLKKNLEKKIELCEKAEELILEKSVKKSFQLLQKYHDEWRDIGPVPNEKKDEIWERFSAITKKIHQKRRDFYADLREKQNQNYEAKAALCDKVEAINEEEIKAPKMWQQKTDEVLSVQKEWRTIGFAPRNVNDEIWNRFRTALNTFFKHKREYFKLLKEDQKENYNKKLDICAQAEAIQDSENWKATTNELIQLQKEWKEIGPVPKKYSDKIWKRFRAACDHFFNRKSEFFSNIGKHEEENLQRKKELIENVKTHDFTDDNEENLSIIKDFQRQWMEIGHVPIKEKDKVQKEFRDAVDEQMERLKISAVDKSTIKYKTKIEKIKESSNSNRIIRKERNVIYNKINKLKNDINLWENNIGFLASSKNADILKDEFLKKIESAKQEIVILEEKLKYINKMDDE